VSLFTVGQNRFLAGLVLGAAVFAASLAIATSLAAEDEPGATTWDYVEGRRDELRSIAVQACRFDGDTEQTVLTTLRVEYDKTASAYDSSVRGRLAAGMARPRGIGVAAPSFDSSLERLCPQVASGFVDAALEPTPPPFAGAGGDVLTTEELDAAALAAGWPQDPGWWPEMRQIIQCESGRNRYAYNASDPNGGSYGLTQLNGTQHFDKSGEDFELRWDPVVNLRVALWLRTVRGHFGGAGGWKICSERYGIQ
jgi:hypothetical protein